MGLGRRGGHERAWSPTRLQTSSRQQEAFRSGLQVASAEVSDVAVETSGDTGTASFRVELGLQGIGTWAYDGAIDLTEVDGDWRVAFTPASLHPALSDGTRLQRTRAQGPRAVDRGRRWSAAGGRRPG